MTTSAALASITDIVADLSRALPARARFQRVLEALMESFACDAAALLQLEEGHLLPRAVKGLSPESLERRFVVAEQPRLQEILHSRGPVRFAADSALPDPFDGLLSTPGQMVGGVHDCMGAPLHLDGRVWGVLTLDALAPGAFGSVNRELFETFVAVAAASIRAADVIVSLESELQRREQVQALWLAPGGDAEMVGDSEVMRRLRWEAQVVASSDVPVLIHGETGVGKELVARLIHCHSPRAHKPMIQINCAALPETLAESELFGHVRGAFSGASQERAGKFELADGGTLMLDEVGELPLSIQAKLLRALQSGEIQRVGSDRTHHSDVRLVAATNRNLEEEVRAHRFRADLYHRLNVYPLTVPPLRERGDDVLLLADCFLRRAERRLGLHGVQLTEAARQWLLRYAWPGNVRELEHAITRAVVRVMGEGHARGRLVQLGPRHLGADPPLAEPGAARDGRDASLPEATLNEALDQFRRELIGSRLRRYDNNLAAAARSLGLDRGNFYRQLKRLGLK